MFSFSHHTPAEGFVFRSTARSWISIVLLVLLATASGPAASPPASAEVKLQVRSDGRHFIIEWDRSAPEVSRATAAKLHIVEGAGAPFFLLLTPEQLRAGSMTYGSFPFMENVQFRLEIIVSKEESGGTVERGPLTAEGESVVNVPPKMPPLPAAPLRVFVPPHPAPPMRVAAETRIPEPPEISVARAEHPAVLGSPVPARWTYAPPAAGRTAGAPQVTVIVDPPGPAVPAVAPAASVALLAPDPARWKFVPPDARPTQQTPRAPVIVDPPASAASSSADAISLTLHKPEAARRAFVPPTTKLASPPAREVAMLEPPSIAVFAVGAPRPAFGAQTLHWTFAPPAPRARIQAVPAPVIPEPPVLFARIPTAARTANKLLEMRPPPPYIARTYVSRAAVPPPTIDVLSNIGYLTITSEPPGASVEINENPAGTTPVTIQVSPLGIGFTVALSKAGYMKWTVQSLVTSQPGSLHAKLLEISK